MPNWVPMFGRKICLDYRGNRRQCSNCYGPHAKKYCRSERVGMDNFVTGFRKRYPFVPEELYGRLANVGKISVAPVATKADTRHSKPVEIPTSNAGKALPEMTAEQMPESNRPKIRIALKRGNGTDWNPVQESLGHMANSSASNSEVTSAHQSESVQNVTSVASVAEGVSSFLSGIRASFRQDNVHVQTKLKQGRATASRNSNGI